MSDIFDHAMDAYESYYSGSDNWYDKKHYPNCEFVPNPLHYHTKISFTELVAETDLARLITYLDKDIWVPKSIMKKFSLETNTVYVHTKTFLTIVKQQGEFHV